MIHTPLSYAIIGILLIGVSVNGRGFKWLKGGRGSKVVYTKYGAVRGWMAEDGDYYAYLGIPYASPPTGRNRFKAPSPTSPWKGILDATRPVKCPQMGVGTEDCLVLNIFTPTKILKEPLPVLVYIHGGSFLIGTGQTEGVETLINQNVIVVTINYRLGALGFLCLGIEEAPGNAGLKDQVAALQWIQDNISAFGGNPKEVTVYGMSAGAASVELLILSNVTKGLFQKAIIESASATPVWVVDGDPVTTAMNVASFLNFPVTTKNLFELVNYYQNIPHTELSTINYDYYNNLTDGTFGFVPCIEKNNMITTTFLTESPHDILSKGNFNRVPTMFMFASSEGLYLRSAEYYEQNYKERMAANFLDFMPADLIFDTVEIKKEISQNVKQFYFGFKTIGDHTLDGYLNYFGDYLILHGLLNSVEIHSKNENPVYLMEFAYKGKLGSYEKFYENMHVAGHGDVVKHVILNKMIENKSDKLAVDRLSRLIANFMKHGNPTPQRSSLIPILWPAVQPKNVSCFYMSDDFSVHDEPYWDRKEFWDMLYKKFRRPLKPVHTGLL